MRFDLTSKKIPLRLMRVARNKQHLLYGDLGSSLLIYKLLRYKQSNSEHDPDCGENFNVVDGGSYVVL
jgi:hypothetical protein